MSLNSISDKALKTLNDKSFNYNEHWGYTDINKFKKINYSIKNPKTIKNKVWPKSLNNTQNEQDSSHQYNHKKKNYISILNNSKIKNNLSNPDIISTNISSLLEENKCNSKNIFNKIIPNYKNEFILYNTAYFQEGFFLFIKNNTVIENPIQINSIINIDSPNEFLNLRYLLHFGKNIKTQVIIKDSFIYDISINNVMEIVVEENSTVDIIINSEKENINQIMNFSSIIKKNSELNIYAIDISGKLVRNNYFINLEYENSKFNYSGISLLNSNNHIDNFIEINHKNKYTFSSSNQKNILRENSKSIFYSKSTIDKKSKYSEAQQKNKNMMLSKKATVHSNPQLEIYNNDVKCSHGSTTGELDEDMLFYLRTRGLNLKQAKKMLLEGFLNEFIDSIGNNQINENLKHKINNWL